MRHGEERPAEPAYWVAPAAPIDVVLIGHVGSATDRTPEGTTTYTGGSGFAVAFAASALLDRGVGLVTQVGEDFDLASLRLLPIDMQGVAVRSGASATFFIDHFRDGSLSFRSELGVAAEPGFDSVPGLLFPGEIRAPGDRATAAATGVAGIPPRPGLPGADLGRHVRAIRGGGTGHLPADLRPRGPIFLNEAEYRALYHGRPRPSAPTLLKHGRAGAEFLADGARHQVPAPPADEVDPIGAGEILAGAFLALRARGLAEDRALSYAVAAASRSVTEFGVARPGVTRELNRVREELAASLRS